MAAQKEMKLQLKRSYYYNDDNNVYKTGDNDNYIENENLIDDHKYTRITTHTTA